MADRIWTAEDVADHFEEDFRTLRKLAPVKAQGDDHEGEEGEGPNFGRRFPSVGRDQFAQLISWCSQPKEFGTVRH